MTDINDLKLVVQEQKSCEEPMRKVRLAKNLDALREDMKGRLNAMRVSERRKWWGQFNEADRKWMLHFLFKDEYEFRAFMLPFWGVCILLMIATMLIMRHFGCLYWDKVSLFFGLFSLFFGLFWFYGIHPICGICEEKHWFGVCPYEYTEKAMRDKECMKAMIFVLTFFMGMSAGLAWMTFRPKDMKIMFAVMFALIIIVRIVTLVIKARLRKTRSDGAINSPELSEILFHPSAREGDEPEGFEVIETPVDGAVIKSHLFWNADANKDDVVIFFHGNGEIAADWFPYARQIADAFKANLLLVDYRGYGLSTGTPTYGNMLSDAEAIVDAANARFKRFIHVFGRSIGSAAAIHVAWKCEAMIATLVIDSGFAHLPALIERLGRGKVRSPKLPEGFWDNVGKLRHVSAPTLFLHGVEDIIIPIEAARENFAASESSAKELVELPDAGHNDTVLSTGYFGKIGAFMKPQIENLENRLKEFLEKYPYGQCPRCGSALDEGDVCYNCICPLPTNTGTMPVAPWSADGGVSFEWHGVDNDNDLLVLFQWQPKTAIEHNLTFKPESEWSDEEKERMQRIKASQLRYVATISFYKMFGSHCPLRIFTIERSVHTTTPLFCEWRTGLPNGRCVHGPYVKPEEENAVLDFVVETLTKGKHETLKRIGSVKDGWRLKCDIEHWRTLFLQGKESAATCFANIDKDETRIIADFDLEILSPERWAGKFIYNLPCKFEMGRYCETCLPPPGVPFCALNLKRSPDAAQCSRRYIRLTQTADKSGFKVELLADNDCKVAGIALKKGESAVAKAGDEIAISPDWRFKVVQHK